MRIQVTRQACCAADDQVGPLDATYVCEPSAPLSKLIQEIVASGFLQFSSTHDRITGEVDGKRIVVVGVPGGPAPQFFVDQTELVGHVVGQRTLDFRFRHV